MDYPSLKLLHLIAAATWLSGLVGNGLAVALLAGSTSAGSRALLGSLCTWNRRVTLPAALLLLAAGASIAWMGGWLVMPWLWIKLALVAALLPVQIGLGRALRRMAGGDASAPPTLLRVAAPAVFCAGLIIGVLALTKPAWGA